MCCMFILLVRVRRHSCSPNLLCGSHVPVPYLSRHMHNTLCHFHKSGCFPQSYSCPRSSLQSVPLYLCSRYYLRERFERTFAAATSTCCKHIIICICFGRVGEGKSMFDVLYLIQCKCCAIEHSIQS